MEIKFFINPVRTSVTVWLRLIKQNLIFIWFCFIFVCEENRRVNKKVNCFTFLNPGFGRGNEACAYGTPNDGGKGFPSLAHLK